MTSLPSPVVVLSDTESDDDDAALSRLAAESFSSSLATQGEVDALCNKHSVPTEFTARPAGERRACTPPPPGAVCIYAHALEAGLHFPLPAFFSEVLSYFGVAPGQLTPNGWRVLVCFVVLCRSAGVPPSVAVFRHFFTLRSKGWCFFRCRRGARVLFTGLTSPKTERGWKRHFFFLNSPEPWLCPVRWGEPPSKISNARPFLSWQDKKSVEKLEDTHGAAVDLRTYFSETNLATTFSSNLAGAAAPPPPLQLSPRSTGSKGMDLTTDEDVPPAEKLKAEPVGDTPQLAGKKRKQEEIAGAKDVLSRSEPNAPPAAPPLSGCLAPGLRVPPGSDPNPRHMPVPDTHDGDSSDWEEARQVLDCMVTPSRERELAAAKPSDVVASTYVAMLQAANYASFCLGYALELEQKQTAKEHGAAALQEELDETKAELGAVKEAGEAKLEKARAELAAARRATEAEVESAKTAAVQLFLE
ncbi:unnamed protein product [Alopecurus aequalis]